MTSNTAAPAFSVLLPTRNRFDLAQGMIATVLGQDFPDWELIVADNASDDDIAAWCAGLGDPRVRCIRSDVPLSVTENWNRAMDASRGRHVVMMGDDDSLVPEYFEQMQDLLARFPETQVVYHGAWHFAFPGAHPKIPNGSLTDVTGMQMPLAGRVQAEWLPRDEARALARAAFNMRCRFAFNMQHFLFSRSMIDQLRQFGQVFQGPYPDFYTACLTLMQAERLVVWPRPMVVIGISKKSYGFHYFNGREENGAAMLGIDPQRADRADPLAEKLLPGPLMNSAWLLSVARAAQNVKETANIPRYRRLQILTLLQAEDPAGGFRALQPSLSLSEQLLGGLVVQVASAARRLPGDLGKRVLGRLHGMLARQYQQPPLGDTRQHFGGLADMRDVFAFLEDGGPA